MGTKWTANQNSRLTGPVSGFVPESVWRPHFVDAKQNTEHFPPLCFILLWQSGIPASPITTVPANSLHAPAPFSITVSPASYTNAAAATAILRGSGPGFTARFRAHCLCTCIHVSAGQQAHAQKQQPILVFRLVLVGQTTITNYHFSGSCPSLYFYLPLFLFYFFTPLFKKATE